MMRFAMVTALIAAGLNSTGSVAAPNDTKSATDAKQTHLVPPGPPQPTPFLLSRSYIFVTVRDDSDLPQAYRWLEKDHVDDSISQFGPYVTRYVTFRALPLPTGAEDFGAYKWIMTEHWWLVNPFNTSSTTSPNGVAFGERYDRNYMEITRQPTDQGLRPEKWVGSRNGYHPTVFAFAPPFWEDDYKGSDRTIKDGANYRWLTIFKYPDGVSREEGDRWFQTVLAPEIAKLPQVNRFMSSRTLDKPSGGPFQRVAEIWFNNSKDWQAAMETLKTKVAKPAWAKYDRFPYLEPYKDFTSEFLLDTPEQDHFVNRGYTTSR